jgi:prophage maintenance system killer protein
MNAVTQPTVPMRRLTLQDLIWLNLVATKRVNGFDFEKLEQTCFRQYGYGAVQDVVGQAARMAESLVRLRPFDAGNEETAALAFAALLRLNGLVASGGADAIVGAEGAMREALAQSVQIDPEWDPGAEPNLEAVVAQLVARP